MWADAYPGTGCVLDLACASGCLNPLHSALSPLARSNNNHKPGSAVTPDDFIEKWRGVTQTERASAQSHFIDLCRLLDLPDPIAADPQGEWFCFERGAKKAGGGDGWADVWRRGCFGWEYKRPGKDLDAAFKQLQLYTPALEYPPLLIVSDIQVIRIHTAFTRLVPTTYLLKLDDLRDPAQLNRLKWAFTDPERLKPTQTRAHLTEQAAAKLGALAQTWRGRGHDPLKVAHFCQQVLFCLFAEDIDLLPDKLSIIAILVGAQVLIIRRRIANLRRVLVGFLFILIGLTFFLEGLERALFPLGKLMAEQLTAPAFLGLTGDETSVDWREFGWIYLFAFTVGFSTTIAEPSLIAVAMKANEVSGGAIHPWGLRIAVALGVAIGIALGSFRIITGTPLPYYIITGYIFVLIQTWFAPRMIIALAYDSGGVTTSTVTVPLVAALGLGLSSHIPGRNPMLDGFGLIAFASLFPMMTVMGYAQLSEWLARRAGRASQPNSP